MVTLCLLVLTAVLFVVIALGLIAVVGAFATGLLAVILDVIIGISPIILIIWLVAKCRKEKKA